MDRVTSVKCLDKLVLEQLIRNVSRVILMPNDNCLTMLAPRVNEIPDTIL